jgi:hypothetical protein
MSFGESVFSAGFIQKTIKGDLHVRRNHRIPPQELRGKTLEDSRRLSTEAHPGGFNVGPASLWGPPSASHCYVSFSLPPRLHLHYSLSRFDPRAHDGRSGLYIPAPAPSLEASWNPNSYPLSQDQLRGVPWKDHTLRASYQEKISPH